jgi:uncharacterized membrane protein YeaQ/YmgE (transglycosylase-associated protein family)
VTQLGYTTRYLTAPATQSVTPVNGETDRREMGIITWIILGLLAGFVAKTILPGDDPGGVIITTLIGVAGAFIGGFIAKALGFGDPIDEFFDFSTWLGAIIGSILLLLIYRALVGANGRRRTAF